MASPRFKRRAGNRMSKVNRIPWLVAAAALLLVTLGVGTSGPAAARGFCNIDRLGKDELQKEVTNAGAVFFDGGSYLMQMLAAFERGDGDKGKTVGSFAASSFKSASEQYNNIASANKISEIGDNKLAAVKPEDA